MRDLRIFRIFEGSNDILRLFVSLTGLQVRVVCSVALFPSFPPGMSCGLSIAHNSLEKPGSEANQSDQWV